MISSEVQRTLVKSPPELWAELSDPGSLARHLGDLGEIRITRIEPEQLVEWEAEKRTGKVQIKPSGWGTRVTLSVASELPEPGPSVAPEPAPPEGKADASPGESEPAAETVLQSEDPASAHAEESTSDTPAPESLPAEPEPTEDLEGDPEWQAEREPEVAPATPAGLAARKPGGEVAAKPAEAEVEPAAEDTVQAEPYAWLTDEDLQPRRGFFARLFGRRRRPSDLEPEPQDEIASAASYEPQAEAEPDDSVPEGMLEAYAVEEPEFALEAEAAEEPELALEPEAAEEPEVTLEPEAGEEPPADGSTEALETASASPQTTPEMQSTAGEELAVAQAEEPAEEAPLQTQAAGQSEGIAAELGAAEETTDAQVTAVLTSVLDRLGAAHHRPFSRS
jgi:hypothetical protein